MYNDVEFYMQMKDIGKYNFPFKIMGIIFRFIKDIGFKIIYFFIANSLKTLNKFPNKRDTQKFSSFIINFSFYFYFI